jgi:hypothetical protein
MKETKTTLTISINKEFVKDKDIKTLFELLTEEGMLACGITNQGISDVDQILIQLK